MSTILVPRGLQRGFLPCSLDALSPLPTISGTAGVWTNVTPAGLDLNPASNGGDNFGVQGVYRDRSRAGRAYAFTCFNGIWRTTDYGATWTKMNSGGPMDQGKSWGAAVAPDGSYLLACSGVNFTQYSGVDARRQVFRSTDGGVTFTNSGDMGADPYGYDILASDQTKVLVTFHDTNTVALSTDSGVTWVNKGAITNGTTAAEVSSYVHWIDATHVLAISQSGGTGNGTYLGTLSGGAFTWTIVSSSQFHYHGSHNLDIDPGSGAIINPGTNGMERSTTGGTTWGTTIGTGSAVNNITRTSGTLYACWSFPTTGVDAHLQTAAVPGTGTWTSVTVPGGMTNGWMNAAADTDGTRWCVIGGCWNAGIWRYIE